MPGEPEGPPPKLGADGAGTGPTGAGPAAGGSTTDGAGGGAAGAPLDDNPPSRRGPAGARGGGDTGRGAASATTPPSSPGPACGANARIPGRSPVELDPPWPSLPWSLPGIWGSSAGDSGKFGSARPEASALIVTTFSPYSRSTRVRIAPSGFWLFCAAFFSIS